MKGLKWMILITHREFTDDYLEFLKENHVNKTLTKLCQGTATSQTLDVLGIERTDKVMIEGAVRDEYYPQLIRNFVDKTDITNHGNGVVAFIKMGAVGGESALGELAGTNPILVKEEMDMKEEKFCLIITIVDSGNSDLVMHSAREAGASGGTVVHAIGTGADMAKIFGLTISQEKDMIYIIAKKTNRDTIMQAIMNKAGINTDANGVVFSLPVDSVIGIKSFQEESF